MTCWPWRTRSSGSIRRLFTRDLSEDRANRHADTSDVALPEHVAGHDLAGGEDVLRRFSPGHQYACALVHLQTEISERDARTQRVAPERRRVDRLRPVRLVQRQPLRPAVVQHPQVKVA